jgi:hypothetical protein
MSRTLIVVVSLVSACWPVARARSGERAAAATETRPVADASSPIEAVPPLADASVAVAVEAGVDPCQGVGHTEKRADLTCADRKAWFRRIGWSTDCEAAYDATVKPWTAGIEFFPLRARRTLLKVICAPGAYQGYANYFMIDAEDRGAGRLEPLRFRTYESPDGGVLKPIVVTDLWGNETFDEVRKELVVHNRYRGPGDCGTLARYAFPGEQPVLVEMRAHPVCDERETDPDRWPRVKLP